MTVYYVDDGGSNTSPYDTWAKAAPTLAALQTGAATSLTTDGNIVYIGADSVSSGDAAGANITFTGPSNGSVKIISATVGTTTYAKSSSNQITQTTGDFKIIFNGGFELWGLKMRSTGMIQLNAGVGASQVNCAMTTYECTCLIGGNRQLELTNSGSTPTLARHIKLNVYPDQDSGSNNRQFFDLYGGITELINCSITNSASGRNGPIFAGLSLGAVLRVSGMDLSVVSAQSAVLSWASAQGQAEFLNCKTLASPVWTTGATNVEGSLQAINCKSADAPEGLYTKGYWGSVESSTSARTGGAQVEGVSCSWKMISSSATKPLKPLYSPWIYAPITAAGTKTFTVYVSQDGGSADLTDAEVWLELEYMGTADVGTTSWTSDRALGSSSGTAQDDDTTSTWSTITATYKQSLAISSVSVGEEGLCRLRVGLAKASTTLYVDPLVTVS